MVAAQNFTLVIDAGHGGKDPGTRGVKALEKDVNLKVALAFGKYVERNCPDVKVIYTRKTDVFVELSERAAIANRNKADLFISIHSNALPDGKISRGFETYTLGMHRASDNLDVAKRENSVILVEDNYKQRYAGFDPKSSESYIMFELMQDNNMSNSVELAKMIQTEACALSGRQNKGVHQAGFLVLRETSMPGCLIELGFLTTPDEEVFLDSSDGQDLLAHGIFNAFMKYKKKHGALNSSNKDVKVEEPKTNNKKNNSSKEQPKQNSAPQKSSTPAKEQPKQNPAPQKSSTPAKEQPKQNPAPQKSSTPAKDVPTEGQAKKDVVAGKNTVEKQNNASATQKSQTVSAAKKTDAILEDEMPVAASLGGRPIFKVQIGASSQLLPANSPEFKGLANVEYYQENGMVKYTVGASSDFNEINRLRKSIFDKFPEAFVIAFKDGVKMDVAQAIREFRMNKSNLK
jgi:N-acetylmuramoyl-L-alanine amidase